MPAISQSAQRNSPIGSSIRAQNALLELHTQDKVFEQSDQLMVYTNIFFINTKYALDFYIP